MTLVNQAVEGSERGAIFRELYSSGSALASLIRPERTQQTEVEVAVCNVKQFYAYMKSYQLEITHYGNIHHRAADKVGNSSSEN